MIAAVHFVNVFHWNSFKWDWGCSIHVCSNREKETRRWRKQIRFHSLNTDSRNLCNYQCFSSKYVWLNLAAFKDVISFVLQFVLWHPVKHVIYFQCQGQDIICSIKALLSSNTVRVYLCTRERLLLKIWSVQQAKCAWVCNTSWPTSSPLATVQDFRATYTYLEEAITWFSNTMVAVTASMPRQFQRTLPYRTQMTKGETHFITELCFVYKLLMKWQTINALCVQTEG